MELIKSEPEAEGNLLFFTTLTGVRTCIQNAAVQQAGGQEGLIFTGPDLRAHQLRAGC